MKIHFFGRGEGATEQTRSPFYRPKRQKKLTKEKTKEKNESKKKERNKKKKVKKQKGKKKERKKGKKKRKKKKEKEAREKKTDPPRRRKKDNDLNLIDGLVYLEWDQGCFCFHPSLGFGAFVTMEAIPSIVAPSPAFGARTVISLCDGRSSGPAGIWM
jgi:hypothetical protein